MQMALSVLDIRSVVSAGGTRSTCVVLGVLILCWALGGGAWSNAQDLPGQLQLVPLSPAAKAESGVELVRQGRPAEALPFLEDAFASRPALMLSEYGAVAYWLGKAYVQQEDSARARATWRRGFQRLAEADRFDTRLADAYLRSLTRRQLRNQRLTAVDAYTGLLRRVESDAPADQQAIFRRRVAQIAPLLPDDVFANTVHGERSAEPATWTFRAGAGEALQSWWRGLDPFPATDENERLEEHLTRLVHAHRSFSCEDRTSTLDDRGLTYLRYGAPYKRRDLNYKGGEFFREVFRFGVPVPPASFPKSEIWLYPQVDESGFYLFAEEETSDCFAVATANDLLPSTFKMHRGNSGRGLNIAYSSMMAMRAIYRELALYHPNYGSRYADIANYAGRQEMNANVAEIKEALTGEYEPSGATRSVKVGAGAGQTRRVFSNPNLGLEFPSQFVSRMVSRAEREDEAAAQRRKENMPRQYTALHGNTPSLPVAVRTARFLNDDGTTQTEVYWGVSATQARLRPDDGDASPAPSMIRFSAVRYNRDRSQAQRLHRRLQLPAEPSRLGDAVVGTPVTFRSSALHHLTMQWAQHQLWQRKDSTIAGLGPKRRFTLARADSLRPLRADERRLEMSDLKVLSLPDTALATLNAPNEAARPYPFDAITPDTPLLLDFEVYHLTYGADDRTQYTVSYEVEGRTRRGWTRLFRGQDTRSTSTTMTRSGMSRRTDELILLDLSEIADGAEQDIRVTVRVRDEQAGTSVRRTLDFVLQPREES
jgi:GWxTD domain-containing protein